MHRYHWPEGVARRVFAVEVDEAEKKALLAGDGSDRDDQVRRLATELFFDDSLEDLLEFQPAAMWDDSPSGWPMVWVGLLLDIGCLTSLPSWWPQGQWVIHAGIVLMVCRELPTRRRAAWSNSRPLVELSRDWGGDHLARLRELREYAEASIPLDWALEMMSDPSL